MIQSYWWNKNKNNLEKISQKKYQSPSFKTTHPYTIVPPPFIIYQIPPLWARQAKCIPPPLKKKRGGANYGSLDMLVIFLTFYMNNAIDHFKKMNQLISLKCYIFMLAHFFGEFSFDFQLCYPYIQFKSWWTYQKQRGPRDNVLGSGSIPVIMSEVHWVIAWGSFSKSFTIAL